MQTVEHRMRTICATNRREHRFIGTTLVTVWRPWGLALWKGLQETTPRSFMGSDVMAVPALGLD